MGDYNRSTREISLAGIAPEAKEALDKHLELYELGSILDDALICVEANYDKIKKGLFAGPGPKSLVVTVVLTPRWLLQVIKEDSEKAFARSAQLRDITVTDYEKSPFYSRIQDTGVEVSGGFTGAAENSSSFIGLGKDPAGEKFKAMIIEAVQEAKK